jgi:hypothetical protein
MTVNQWIKRVAPITIGLVLIVLLAFSCSAINRDAIIPELSNPNGTFVTLDDITLTNQEVYQELIDNYGVRVMNLSIVRDLLTNGDINYVELAKQDPDFNVQEELELAIYDMPLAEAQQTYTAAQLAERVTQFETIITLNGYEDQDAFIEELYLEHARELFTKDQILAANSITFQQVVEYYEDNEYNEVCALVMRYPSVESAAAAMRRQGLSVDETGTITLLPDEQELFDAYLAMYNEANGTSLSIDPGSYSSCPESSMVYSWDELSKDNPIIGEILFKQLSNSRILFPDSASLFVSHTDVERVTRGAETSYFLFYKLSGDEINNFLTLIPTIAPEDFQILLTQPASEVDFDLPLIDELIDIIATEQASVDSQITSRINQLFQTSNLEVLDPYLFQNVISTMFQMEPNNGHPTIAYRYERGGEVVNVTADEFFEQLQRYAPAAASNVLNNDVVLRDRALFDEVVTSELQAAARSQLQGFRDSFVAGEYEQFGFTPQTSTWLNFLYNGFGFRSEASLYNAIISQEVTTAVLADFATTPEQVNRYYDLLVEEYNNYFSIELIHMLIYRDDNNDGTPDPLLSSTWSPSDVALANELADLLRDRVELESELQPLEFSTFQDIVSEFNTSSLVSDPDAEEYSQWAKFKQAGFLLKTEDLRTVVAGMMVGPFEDEAKAMYDTMVAGVLREYVSPNNVETIFGVHVIYGDNYTLKLDAYPTNDALSIPSRDDLSQFIQGDSSLLSEDVLNFINQYFTPKRAEFDDAYRVVILDELRQSIGSPSFSNASLNIVYRDYIAANQTAANLQFNPVN